MTVTPIENALLGLIRAETKRVLCLSPYRDVGWIDSDEWVDRQNAIRDLRDGLGIKISTDWIGNTPADRQARRRGLLSLQAAGLVELFATTTGHATHVALIDPDDADEAKLAPPG